MLEADVPDQVHRLHIACEGSDGMGCLSLVLVPCGFHSHRTRLDWARITPPWRDTHLRESRVDTIGFHNTIGLHKTGRRRILNVCCMPLCSDCRSLPVRCQRGSSTFWCWVCRTVTITSCCIGLSVCVCVDCKHSPQTLCCLGRPSALL